MFICFVSVFLFIEYLPFFLKKYAATLSEQLGLKGKPQGKLGSQLDATTIKLMKDDQIVQLYELMLAAKNLKEEENPS